MEKTNYIIHTAVLGCEVSLTTNSNCFSPRALDQGTLALLSVTSFYKGQKVLDLGCGYGVVGIVAAKIVGDATVFMSDINRDALLCSRQNIIQNEVPNITIIKSNCFREINETAFDLILCNPPYHVDFTVPKEMIEKGFNRLKVGGTLLMVTKRKEWYKNKLIHLFGGVKIHEVNGYYVFQAEKRGFHYVNAKIAKHKSNRNHNQSQKMT